MPHCDHYDEAMPETDQVVYVHAQPSEPRYEAGNSSSTDYRERGDLLGVCWAAQYLPPKQLGDCDTRKRVGEGLSLKSSNHLCHRFTLIGVMILLTDLCIDTSHQGRSCGFESFSSHRAFIRGPRRACIDVVHKTMPSSPHC
jgi:hypothetical protein